MRRVAPLLALLLLVGPVRSEEEEVPPEEIAGYRIYVTKPGLVRMPFPERAPRPFTLTTRGKPVAFLVDGDSLVFWGEPDLESHDARGRCYHLNARVPGDDVFSIEGKPVPATVDEGATSDTGKRTIFPDEPRRYHPVPALDVASLAKSDFPSLSVVPRPGGYWFYGRTLTFTSDVAGRGQLDLSGIYVLRTRKVPLPGGRFVSWTGLHSEEKPGTLHVKFAGKDVTVYLRGQGEEHELEVPLAAGLNRFEIAAEQSGLPLVQNASLTFEAPPKPGVPFVALGPTLFAAFDGLAADLENGDLLEVKAGKKGSFVKAKKGHRVLLLEPKKGAAPARIEACRKHEELGKSVEWQAVAPRALLDGIKRLEEHRRSQGLTTRLVALEDLLDDVTDGTFDPAVLRYASRLSGSLLLVGDACRAGRPDDGPWLPTNLVDTYDNGASASDRWPGEGLAIGRFPCRTKEEVEAMVAKTIAYEKAAPGPWQTQLSFVCGEARFGPFVDKAIENLFVQAVGKRVPESFDVDVTYANPESTWFYPPDEFSKKIVARLSEGPLVFDYIGHGQREKLDEVRWAKKKFDLFTVKDAEKVACPEGRYPIALLTCCSSGAFDDPERCVAKALALNPRGPVAVLASSRISHTFANALLSLELNQRLFEENDDRLGTRIRKALDGLSMDPKSDEGKLVVKFSAAFLDEEGLGARVLEDERYLYNLLGDPALVVRLPRRISVTAPAQAPAGGSIEVAVEKERLLAVTLERPRTPREDLQPLDPGTPPESMKDPAVHERVRATWAKANEYVLARGSVDGARGVLAVPGDLAPGTYVVKVLTATGGAGSGRLTVQKPSPPKKKYY